MKVLKIAKINLFALAALPLLLLALAAKLLAKAMDKIIAIIRTVLIVFIIGLLFEAARNLSGALDVILMVFLIILIGGVFSAIIIWLLSLISSIIMFAIAFVIGMLDGGYELLYSGYAALFYRCKTDYESISKDGNPYLCGLSCLIFTLLRAVNRVIILFVTHALKLLIAVSAVLVIGGIVLFNIIVGNTFGISLFAYLKLFPTFEVVYGIVMYFATMLGMSSILISLGREWSEWGKEMEMSTSNYEEYVNKIQSQWQGAEVSHGGNDGVDDARVSRCVGTMEILNRHMEAFGAFAEEISPVVEESEDYVLRSDFGEYVSSLQEISGEFAQYNGEVPVKIAEKYIQKIKELDNLKKSIRKRADKVVARQVKNAATSSFFSGCDTIEKLDKRYKALCKTYHPDTETGDEETFKVISDEYEKRKKSIG